MELEPTEKHTKFTEKWHGNQYLHFCDGKKNTHRRNEYPRNENQK
jgi:hypothetical protein